MTDDLEFAQTVTDDDRYDLEAAVTLAEYLHDDFSAAQMAWLS